MEFIKLVLFSICFNCVLCSVHYKASVVDVSRTDPGDKYESLIFEAAKNNVDVLLLSRSTKQDAETLNPCSSPENYDQVVKSVSSSARSARVYVVVQLFEKTRCDDDGVVFNNVVFDRDGRIIAVKPVNDETKCNITDSNITKFTADFGVTFAVLNEDDLLMNSLEYYDGIKNFIVSRSHNRVPYLISEQFTSSWSYINGVNVISSFGVFGGSVDTHSMSTAELQKDGGSSSLITTSPVSHHHSKPMNTEASVNGYTDSVCDGGFCCNFYVKTSHYDPKDYYLSASVVVLQLKKNTVNIRSCAIGSQSKRDVKFDKISISGNFSNSILYPVASTVEQTTINKISIRNNTNVELYDTNVISFGVMSRDYVETNKTNINYVSYENVQEFFDYVWIRVRVLLFIVSIYILEMI